MSVRRGRPPAPSPGLQEAKYDPQTSQRQARLERLRPKDRKGRNVMRLESLRTSPYMFFHGETEEYTEAARERDVQRMAWMEQNAEVLKQQKQQGAADKSTYGHTSVRPLAVTPTPQPAVLPVLVDSLYDDLNTDAFAGGAVLQTAERISDKVRQRTAATCENPAIGSVDDVAVNMQTVWRALVRCVVVDHAAASAAKPSGAGWSFENTDPSQSVTASNGCLISVAAFKSELRDVFDVTNERVIDAFVRGVAGRSAGRPGVPETISFTETVALLDLFVNGSKQAKDTVHSCFALFDTRNCNTISLAALRALRGKPDKHWPHGATFPMLKAFIDYCLKNPAAPMVTVTLDEFAAEWAESGTLAAGFLEEVLRVIVVKNFEGDRMALVGPRKS